MLYNGVVLTSIEVKEKEGDPSKVTFSGANNVNGKDGATFLHKVEESKDTDGNACLEAVKLTIEETKAIINGEGKSKPLFTIHGFNVEPDGYLKTIANLEVDESGKKGDQFSKFNLIPVLWPSIGGIIGDGYGDDRELAKLAGESFTLLKDKVDVFPSKSLVCHSMGNRVLRHAASSGFKFDNVFMVAADVRYDLFWKSYISEAKGDENHESYDGMLIYGMLSTDDNDKPKGKIYVLHSHLDGALLASSNLKGNGTRLGLVGPYKESKKWNSWKENKKLVDDKIVDYIEAKDCGDDLKWNQFAAHNYQFWNFAIDFYESKKI